MVDVLDTHHMSHFSNILLLGSNSQQHEQLQKHLQLLLPLLLFLLMLLLRMYRAFWLPRTDVTKAALNAHS